MPPTITGPLVMNKKFILTADLHMGLRQYGSSRREWHFYNAVFDIVNHAINDNIKTICVAGDALDSIYPKEATMRFVKGLNQLMIDKGLTMYVSSGNHDNTEHSWFELLEDSSTEFGIKVVDNKQVATPDGLRIYGIKSYSKDGIMSALENDVPADTDIILIHTNCNEFVTYDAKSRSNKLFSINEFPFEKFKDKEHVYVCIGDTHITKQIDLHNVTFVSPGSTEVTKSNEDLDKYIFEMSNGEFKQRLMPPCYVRLRTDGVIKTPADIDAFLGFFDNDCIEKLKQDGGVMYIYYDPVIKDEVISRLNTFFYPYPKVIRKYIPQPAKNYVSKKDIVEQDNGDECIMTLSEFVHTQTPKYNLSPEGVTLVESLINNAVENIDGMMQNYIKEKQLIVQ